MDMIVYIASEMQFVLLPTTLLSVTTCLQASASSVSVQSLYLLHCANYPFIHADCACSFHMDHAASLPYVLAKTNFKGRVFMTHPTKAIYKWLMQDSVRVQ